MFWIAIAVVFAIFAIFAYVTLIPFRYWSRRGVTGSSISELWSYNIKIVFQLVAPAEAILKLHKQFPNERCFSICHYFIPALFLRSPELIRQLAIKDFDYFTDRVSFAPKEVDSLFSKNLASLTGDEWRAMRPTLSPSFTGSKMRGMFGLIEECAKNFVEFFEGSEERGRTVNTKDVFTKYANDVIASAAFGVTCNSLCDPRNKFYLMGKKATDFSGIWKNISFVLMFVFPKLAKMLKLKVLTKEVNEFFRKLIKDNVEQREKEGIVRPDMIHLLMEAKKGKLKYEDSREIDTGFATAPESSIGRDEKFRHLHLTDDDITAQALVFFFAGFDSSSSLMSFMAYELAINPEVQQRLQDEIDDTLRQCNGSLTYEALFKMRYLDMVVSETLRKWPNVPALDRVCVKPYIIEPSNENEKPVRVHVGDLIWFPVYALHWDPKFYPDPERFDPERFNQENRLKIVPYSYFPFGVGPRSCIGNRFALLETKLLFVHLLSKFDVVPIQKTEVPLTLCKRQFSLAASNGIYVGFRPKKVKPE